MSTATIQPPHLSTDELKLARRLSRRKGLFAPDLLKAALRRAFVMLRPDILWKNPVMFVVEVGTVLSIVYTVYKAVQGCIQFHSTRSAGVEPRGVARRTAASRRPCSWPSPC